MSAAALVAIGNFYQHVEDAYEEILGRKLRLSKSLEIIIEATLAHIDLCDLCKYNITQAPGSYQKIKEAVAHTLRGEIVTIPNSSKEAWCACTIA